MNSPANGHGLRRLSPCFAWTGAHLASARLAPTNEIPAIAPDTRQRLADLDIWDMWPLEWLDGAAQVFEQGRLWMALAAPVLPDPEDRHAIARIHFLLEQGQAWRDCGPAFPDGHSPGSREWSGSALYDPESRLVTCWFTAAGRRDEANTTFEQRLFCTCGMLEWSQGSPRVAEWTSPQEVVTADGEHYLRVIGSEGGVGTIKAFRDPAHFFDFESGKHLLFFTASLANSASPWNGAIGVARADHAAGPWQVCPPVVTADGLNNELERPHMRVHGGLYYLFWSTQRKVFDPAGITGPTGLYGVVGPTPFGPFQPLNGTGLVAANPATAPFQAYSWWVLSDLSVTSFSDLPGVCEQAVEPSHDWRRQHFGGCVAPYFQLELDGANAWIPCDKT